MVLVHEGTRLTFVALLAEGVDRNLDQGVVGLDLIGSPSSRRAWIEIGHPGSAWQPVPSPSSRRAWIEIICNLHPTPKPPRRPPRGGRG